MYNFIHDYNLFIFDLDDTLVETEIFHYEAWLHVIKERLGYSFDMSFQYFTSKFHSKQNDSIQSYIVNELNIKEYENVKKDKNMYFIELVKKNTVKIMEGAQELLEVILLHNKDFVIVTNSLKQNLDYFSDLFPILKKSKKNYYPEILIKKKPHMECYLQVINDFPNYKCIGFEDSITGIQALSYHISRMDIVFINKQSYYYYKYIIDNYNIKFTIQNYNQLK